jgi:hypothetical protein
MQPDKTNASAASEPAENKMRTMAIIPLSSNVDCVAWRTPKIKASAAAEARFAGFARKLFRICHGPAAPRLYSACSFSHED